MSSNFAECRYYTNFKWPYFPVSLMVEATVTWSGVLVVLYVLHMLIWPWPDPRSWLLTFWSSANCTFLHLSPPPFWRAAQNWWLITTVCDLVYSYLELDFWISPPVGGHVTSEFAKCWYHQNSLPFISTLAEARSLWLWLHTRPVKLLAPEILAEPGITGKLGWLIQNQK